MIPLRRSLLSVRREVLEDGTIRLHFTASTATPDRYQDIIDQASWRLDNYRMNPVVMLDHDYRVEKVVGRGEVAIVDGALDLVPTWDLESPHGPMVAGMVDRGTVSAVSVGFLPGKSVPRASLPKEDPRCGERGWVYFDCDLLEVSVVAVPANPEALAAKGAAKDWPPAASVSVGSVVDEVLRLLREMDALPKNPESAESGLDRYFPPKDR